MNKKIFIKNRPFDVQDANDMQVWTEDAIKKAMKSMYTYGIATGLNVTVNTALKVNVNIGAAFDSNYDLIDISASQLVTLTTANATNPRIDKICIGYKSNTADNVDTTNKYGMGASFIYSQNKLDTFEVKLVTGTPAASPVVPATPAGYLDLASVRVNAGATSLVAGNITDLRTMIRLQDIINNPEVSIGTSTPANTNVLWIDMN